MSKFSSKITSLKNGSASLLTKAAGKLNPQAKGRSSSCSSHCSTDDSSCEEEVEFSVICDPVLKYESCHMLFYQPELLGCCDNKVQLEFGRYQFELLTNNFGGTLKYYLDLKVCDVCKKTLEHQFRITTWTRTSKGKVTTKRVYEMNALEIMSKMPELFEQPAALNLFFYVHIEDAKKPVCCMLNDFDVDKKSLESHMKYLAMHLTSSNFIQFICLAYHLNIKNHKRIALEYGIYHFCDHENFSQLDKRIYCDLLEKKVEQIFDGKTKMSNGSGGSDWSGGGGSGSSSKKSSKVGSFAKGFAKDVAVELAVDAVVKGITGS